jgi:drug/metabolite transporter (DMT)-like permease
MSEKSENPGVLAWVLIAVLALIWGSSFILIKKGLVALSPMQVGSLRIFWAGLVMSPFAFRSLKKIPKEKYTTLFLAGLSGNLLPSFLFSIAGSKINSSLSGILNGLTPVFALSLGFLAYKLKVTKNQIWGIVLGFIGSASIVLFDNPDFNIGFNEYAFYVVAATVLYGLSVNIIKTGLSEFKPLESSSVSLLAVGILAGIYLFSTDFVSVIQSSPKGLESTFFVLTLATFGTAIAQLLFYKLVLISSTAFSSSVTYFIPIVAMAWGLFDNESFNILHVVSMALIFGGVYLTNRK